MIPGIQGAVGKIYSNTRRGLNPLRRWLTFLTLTSSICCSVLYWFGLKQHECHSCAQVWMFEVAGYEVGKPLFYQTRRRPKAWMLRWEIGLEVRVAATQGSGSHRRCIGFSTLVKDGEIWRGEGGKEKHMGINIKGVGVRKVSCPFPHRFRLPLHSIAASSLRRTIVFRRCIARAS